MVYETFTQRAERLEAQQEKANFIPAPTAGVTIDAQARTAIDAIRQLLINEGIMKSS